MKQDVGIYLTDPPKGVEVLSRVNNDTGARTCYTGDFANRRAVVVSAGVRVDESGQPVACREAAQKCNAISQRLAYFRLERPKCDVLCYLYYPFRTGEWFILVGSIDNR
jgi:hypothetical protein